MLPPSDRRRTLHTRNLMPETLYAIDVFSLVFQVFHAIPPMTGANGQPTNAVFGFTRDLLNILKQKQPDFLVCALDSPGPGKREEEYADYKANRDEMPDELRPQIPVIIEVIEAFGIPAIGLSGWEADDILATLAHRAEEQSVAARIVTSDKDARQLISPLVRLYNVRKDVEFDETDLLDTWGIRPDQVVDFQALVGDKVDNVPGVPLVGPKKASALLNDFGTLEDVLARADEAPGKKLSENLKTYADQARISRFLVELKRDLDFEFEWDSARPGRFDIDRLTEIFRECGFRRFTDEVRELASAGGEAISKPALFEEGEPIVDVVTDEPQLAAVLDRLKTATQAGIRLELSGLDPLTSEIAGLTIAWDHAHASFVPLSDEVGRSHLKPANVWPQLAAALADSKIRLSGHDLKSTLVALRQAGVAIGENATGTDSMVGGYLLSAGSRNHSLARLVEQYRDGTLEPLSALNEATGGELPKLTAEQLALHSAEEACLALQVVDQLHGNLLRDDLAPLYDDLERPLIAVLAELEHSGIRVDREELDRQNTELTERVELLVAEIHAEAGEEFNIDSPKQLRGILFDKLELPVLKKTKTGPSTDQEVLEQLAAIHPLPEKIIDTGTWSNSRVRTSMPCQARRHRPGEFTSFSQVAAATGRLSSSNPNLQNIPIRTPEGERIRKAFVPGEPGWKLLCADYSQIDRGRTGGDESEAGVRRRCRHSPGCRGGSLRRRTGRGRHQPAADRQSRQLRSHLRPECFRPLPGSGHQPRGSCRLYRRLLRPLSRRRRVPRRDARNVPRRPAAKTILGARRAISGSPPGLKQAGQLSMPRADRRQHGDPGLSSRPHQTGNDQRPPPPAPRWSPCENAPADPRRTGLPGHPRSTSPRDDRQKETTAMPLGVITVDIATGDNWHAAKALKQSCHLIAEMSRVLIVDRIQQATLFVRGSRRFRPSPQRLIVA